MAKSKKTTPPVRSAPCREARISYFLTQDELRRVKGIRSKRDKAIFLVAYRYGLRASEIGLLQRTDVEAKQGRISMHRLKGSLSAVYPLSRRESMRWPSFMMKI